MPLLIFSLNLINLFDSDKYISSFSLTLVTLFCKSSFKSFSCLVKASCFCTNDDVTSLLTLSNKLSISVISFSIVFFKSIVFSITLLYSFVADSIVIFSSFNDSSSVISINLCPK